MLNPVFFDFFLPHEFTTKPRPRRNVKRARELKLVKQRGQHRRIVVSTTGAVFAADIPMYEALLMAGYASIAVVVIGCAERADIKVAKALSAEEPLPACFRPDGRSPNPFQTYEQYIYGVNRRKKMRCVGRIAFFS
jgi:hypothetical protein